MHRFFITLETISKQQKEKLFFAAIGLALLGGGVTYGLHMMSSPDTFPRSRMVTIHSGNSVRAIAGSLERQGVIRSAKLFTTLASLTGAANDIKSGSYMFHQDLSTWELVNVFTRGDYGDIYTRITVIEGYTNGTIAKLVAKKFPHITVEDFLRESEGKEGRLFPDTYDFLKTVTAAEIVEKMQENFNKKTKSLQKKLGEKKFDEIIIIASMLEHEASGRSDAPVIAGIIYNRLSIGMRLQIDATLKYLTGRGSSNLTMTDLRMSSPYNTYTTKGLPPGAINNPGIVMIMAALNPKKTDYLYYLHDPSGGVHYAKDYIQHLYNKNKHLR